MLFRSLRSALRFLHSGIGCGGPVAREGTNSEFFNEAVAWGRIQGASNVQWVGGEPTIHLPAILDVMSRCPMLPSVVWKSDFYCTEEAMALLEGVVDVYVPDFKFGNDACARRLAGVDDYLRVVTRNLQLASAQNRVIVRHLLLPGHLECCLGPILRWLGENLPQVELSIRDGYLPSWRAGAFAELRRPVEKGEARRARELACEAGVRLAE